MAAGDQSMDTTHRGIKNSGLARIAAEHPPRRYRSLNAIKPRPRLRPWL